MEDNYIFCRLSYWDTIGLIGSLSDNVTWTEDSTTLEDGEYTFKNGD